MANSGAARPALQRALQTCTSLSLSSSRAPTSFSLLLINHTQVRHATRATIAKARAKAEALARRHDPNAPPHVKPKTVVRHHPNRDQNKQRGLSVMRQTGPRERLSVSGVPLPQPVAAAQFPAVKTDPNHGLWAFFYGLDKPLNTPRDDKAHGRAWTVEELRRKSWKDLHGLWWVCIRERNRIATGNTERKKGGYGYGSVESRERELQVRKTQNAIKHALTERFYAWDDAVKLAKEDNDIVFTENSVRYIPGGESEESSEDSLDWDEDNDIWVEEEDEVKADNRAEDKAVKAVDPSIPHEAGKTQQDAPRA